MVFSVLIVYIIFCQSCVMFRTTSSGTKKYFEKSQTSFVDRTIEIDGTPLHYIQTGKEDNPTLFFVHGSPGSWDAFKDYLADSLLLKKYRMIAIDRPGFGYSDFGEAQDLKTQSKWISEFIDQVDNKKPMILIGHSLGGAVIVKLATENPTRYQNLVIVSGSVDPGAEESENWRNIIKAKPIRYLIPGALRPSNDELWWFKQDLVDMQPELKNITTSVTIIHGTKDQLVPFRNVAFMKREFVNAKTIDIIAIENGNHFIPWEQFKMIRDILFTLK